MMAGEKLKNRSTTLFEVTIYYIGNTKYLEKLGGLFQVCIDITKLYEGRSITISILKLEVDLINLGLFF